MLDFSSMAPEDLGSDEEDMHDYVDIMPVYATTPRALRTCSCSTTLPWSLEMGSDEEDMHDYVGILPVYARVGFDDEVSCSATLPRVLRIWALTKRTRVTMLTLRPTTPTLV